MGPLEPHDDAVFGFRSAYVKAFDPLTGMFTLHRPSQSSAAPTGSPGTPSNAVTRLAVRRYR